MTALRVRSLRDRQVQDARRASWMLLAAVGAVLLIACANVANLLLARTLRRRRELAVRAALGARRGRLIRQALTESLLLALLGGVAGCFLAGALLKLFLVIAPAGIPRLEQATLDFRVLLFAVVTTALSGALFGAAPAVGGSSARLNLSSRAESPGRHRFRQLLVAAQFAVSVVLLTGAGSLLQSLWNLQRVPLGMTPETVITADLALAMRSYPSRQRQADFFEELEARLRRLPGIHAVALSDSVPPAGARHARPYVTLDVEGRAPLEPGVRDMVAWRTITPGYFAALGVPIIAGRAFVDEDRRSAENLVVLSDSLARRLFPGESPLGRRIRLAPWFTVIGVAGDVRNNGLAAQADPEFYVLRKRSTGDPSWRDTSTRRAVLLVRSSFAAEVVAGWIRAELAQMDATLPVPVTSMGQRVERLAARPRFNATLLGLFATLGLALAAIGLYGAVTCLVGERSQEICVRMALGATPKWITAMVLFQTGRWVVAGAAAGVLGAWFASAWLSSLLFQVEARDASVLGLAVAALLAVALSAAWLPSRRAARLDPVVALSHE
jgi:predicted permease